MGKDYVCGAQQQAELHACQRAPERRIVAQPSQAVPCMPNAGQKASHATHLHLLLHAVPAVVHQVAVGLPAAAPHAAPQLVQLRKAKALCGGRGAGDRGQDRRLVKEMALVGCSSTSRCIKGLGRTPCPHLANHPLWCHSRACSTTMTVACGTSTPTSTTVVLQGERGRAGEAGMYAQHRSLELHMGQTDARAPRQGLSVASKPTIQPQRRALTSKITPSPDQQLEVPRLEARQHRILVHRRHLAVQQSAVGALKHALLNQALQLLGGRLHLLLGQG